MTKRATAEERALARATVYRVLALAFSYPTRDVVTELAQALGVAAVAGELIDAGSAEELDLVCGGLTNQDPAALEAAYQRVFTLSYSEDCPLYETAFSARHLFQQAQQQADLAGFYRAFGVGRNSERPDHLAVELEFGYLLALKEARARRDGEADHVKVCREAARLLMGQHLARWAPLIGNRVAIAARGTWYELAARLLVRFIEWDRGFLRLGAIETYRDEPMPIADEPGDLTCPVAEAAVSQMLDLSGSREDEHALAP